MQVILQGSLRHFPPAELLGFLCQAGRKGTLDLEGAGKRTRLLFENETILAAQSRTAGEGLDAAVDLLEWTEGTFTLLDAAVLPEGMHALGLTLAALHEEQKRRAEERAAGFPDATLFRIIEDPALQQQVSLGPEEFRLLFRLASGRTFAELLAEYAIPRRELANRLTHLRDLGLVTTGSDMETTARDTRRVTGEQPRAQDLATVAESVPLPPLPPLEEVPEAERTMMQAPPPPPPPAPVEPVQESIPLSVLPAVSPTEEPVAAPAMQGEGPPERPPTLVGSLTPDEAPDNVFPLLDDECLIGRRATKEVAFALEDGSISSRHAKITRTAEGFVIEDVGSRNGTFVNGDKVTEKRVLNDGDLIRLGKVIMTFNVATQNRVGAPTIPELRLD